MTPSATTLASLTCAAADEFRAVSCASLLKKFYSPLALGLILVETDANRGQHDKETLRWRLAL